MKTIGVWDWFRSFPAAVRLIGRGDVRNVRGRLGQPLRMSDGRTFVPFRHTVRRSAAPTGAGATTAVLHPRFHLRFTKPRHRLFRELFRRVCIITTPFFVGLPGFRSKLWMVDPDTLDYAGLYDWDDADEARAYAEGLSRILRLLSVPGSVSYELVPDVTVDEYLDRNASPAEDVPSPPARRAAGA